VRALDKIDAMILNALKLKPMFLTHSDLREARYFHGLANRAELFVKGQEVAACLFM